PRHERGHLHPAPARVRARVVARNLRGAGDLRVAVADYPAPRRPRRCFEAPPRARRVACLAPRRFTHFEPFGQRMNSVFFPQAVLDILVALGRADVVGEELVLTKENYRYTVEEATRVVREVTTGEDPRDLCGRVI